MTTIILGIFEEGLVYAIMALGVYITYRILDFPDLSVDGTFPLGAAFTATGIAGGFIHPAVALPLSFLLGAVAGCVTGLIHVKLKVRDLLSGIIVMTALYSINLRVAGKSNLPIFSKDTIFSNPWLERTIPQALKPYTVTIILLAIVLICKLLLDAYLKTRSGYLLRAVGDNDLLVTSLAKDKGMVKIIGLAIANGFAALAGSVYCQQKGFHRHGNNCHRPGQCHHRHSAVQTVRLREVHHGCYYRFHHLQGMRIPGPALRRLKAYLWKHYCLLPCDGLGLKADYIHFIPHHPGGKLLQGKEGKEPCLS